MELKSQLCSTRGFILQCLNRTFYGIEIHNGAGMLKSRASLNRTFYGIEIPLTCRTCLLLSVLIVPFMELKFSIESYNRYRLPVLIVPFMELKFMLMHNGMVDLSSLNRTFYGIEMQDDAV